MMTFFRFIRIFGITFVVLTALVTTALAGQTGPTLQEKLGYPANARLLIIHADDFGMSHSVDRAISQALEHGWVTSASVVVPCPWFPEMVTGRASSRRSRRSPSPQ